MNLAIISTLMARHGIRRVQVHEPSHELPYEWWAVELEDSRYIGTGRTIEEAWKAAAKELVGEVA